MLIVKKCKCDCSYECPDDNELDYCTHCDELLYK